MKAETEKATDGTGAGAGWVIQVLDKNFNQQALTFSDPQVTGRQIAHEAGFRPVGEALVLQQLKDGAIEEIRFEELVDLAGAGVERFFVMEGDRTFRLAVDGLRREWPRAELTGLTIRKLAGRDEHFEVVQELQHTPNRVVEEDEVISLDGQGTEKFRTQPAARLITVLYGEKQYEMPRGAYTTEQLRNEFKVEDGYVLALINADGEFDELKPGQKMRLKNGMTFASYVPCGQSS